MKSPFIVAPRNAINLAPLLLVVLLLGISTSSAALQLLLTEQQPLRFAGNMTLVVENVDPQTERVWINLYGDEGILKSDIIGIGGHFTYYGVRRIDLSVNRIYSGGDQDLVSCTLYEGVLTSSSLVNISNPVSARAKSSRDAPGVTPRIPSAGTITSLVSLLAAALISARTGT